MTSCHLTLPQEHVLFDLKTLCLQFIHNKDDVLSATTAKTYKFYPDTITTVELIINAIVSSNKLTQLSADQRKCYFPSEIPLKYFNIYTTNLCLISCRIDAAVSLCGCTPFFYRISENFQIARFI